jgi:hypothetical protein
MSFDWLLRNIRCMDTSKCGLLLPASICGRYWKSVLCSNMVLKKIYHIFSERSQFSLNPLYCKGFSLGGHQRLEFESLPSSYLKTSFTLVWRCSNQVSMVELWAPAVDDVPVAANATHVSCLQRALHKAKRQIEKPLYGDLKRPFSSEQTPTPSTSSDSLDIGDLKQALGAVYAEGGLTRDYAPIAEYEGRHRWDPRAQWTESEEKKLVRRVSNHNVFKATGTLMTVLVNAY